MSGSESAPGPAQAAPAGRAAPTGGISDRIGAARQAGYTDDEIATHLKSSPVWGDKFKAATAAGYSDQDIYAHLGLNVAPPAPPEPLSGAYWDHFFENTAVGRVLKAANTGAEQAGKAFEYPNLPAGAEKAMRDAGIWNDVNAGQQSAVRGFNEYWMRPAALMAWRTVAPVLMVPMIGFSAGLEALAQAGEETGIGREPAGLAEWALTRPETGMHSGRLDAPVARDVPHQLPPSAPPSAMTATPAPLAAAIDAHVVGATEAQFMGTEPAPPKPDLPPAAELEPAPPKDVHELARRREPDLFRTYDALDERRTTLRQQITEQQRRMQENAALEAPGGRDVADLRRRLDDEATTPRLRKKYEARLADLT